MTDKKEAPALAGGGAENVDTKSTYRNQDSRNEGAEQGSDATDEQEEIGPEILDEAPAAIHRPLCIVNGRAYAVALLWLKVPDEKPKTKRVVVRDDGVLFGDVPTPGARPPSELGLAVRIATSLPEGREWNAAGVKRYVAGQRPDPANVFHRTVAVIDRFVHFNKSLTDQGKMCELIACYILGTYFLDAFNVVGYLWAMGDRGSGKTQLLATVSELALLGTLILSGGTYPTLRDDAGLGATLCIDDSEEISGDKRELFLAGNRRGATVTLKISDGDGVWNTERVHVFCPKLFSAMRLPDYVMASRVIGIPMVRSPDEERAKANPLDHASWPHDRRQLIDDLWAIGLANLLKFKQYDERAAKRATLLGRDLDPWRMILAVALWLQEEHGVSDLFIRMEVLSVTYQQERDELEAGDDPIRLTIKALMSMVAEVGGDRFIFETATLTARIKQLEEEIGLDSLLTNEKSVGWTLRNLRLSRPPKGKNRRRWQISRQEITDLVRAYGLVQENAENAENADDEDEERS